MHKKLKAFTLIELMVAMAIIAVLMGLSLFGISTANRISRDNQRRAAVKDVAAALTAHYAQNSEYPSTIQFHTSGNVVVGTQTVPLNGIAKPGSTTDGAQTAYCYKVVSGGYKLGSILESGGFFDLGLGTSVSCSMSDLVVPGL